VVELLYTGGRGKKQHNGKETEKVVEEYAYFP
jgi:hypothetical protein